MSKIYKYTNIKIKYQARKLLLLKSQLRQGNLLLHILYMHKTFSIIVNIDRIRYLGKDSEMKIHKQEVQLGNKTGAFLPIYRNLKLKRYHVTSIKGPTICMPFDVFIFERYIYSTLIKCI